MVISHDDSWSCHRHRHVAADFPLGPFCQHSSPRQPLFWLFSILHHVSSSELYMNEIIQYIVFVSIFFYSTEIHHGIVSESVTCYCWMCSIVWINHNIFTHSVDGHLGSFQFGAIMRELLGTFFCKSFCGWIFSFPLDKCLGVELLDHWVEQFNYIRNCQMICQQVIPLYPPANNVWEFQFYILTIIGWIILQMLASLMAVWCFYFVFFY